MIAAMIKVLEEYPWEYEADAEGLKGVIRWKTLISTPTTATKGVSMGIFEAPPGAALYPHHHAPQEIYYITDGLGEMRIGSEIRQVGPGTVAYVPENVVHGIKNIGTELLKLVWIFPTDSYYDIVYHQDESEWDVAR